VTNTWVTNYWHWLEEENLFEHQVHKKDVWGVYKDPINLHLRLAEMVKAAYATDSLKVIVRSRASSGGTMS
jgi:hypothetical protein